MRRYACLILLVLIAALVGQSAAASDEITLVMWKPNQPELWDRVLALFHEETGVRVNTEIGPHSSTAAHALLSQKLKNKDPDLDVFMMDVVWPPEFGAAGWALPLDDRFPRSQRTDFFQGAIRACTFRGQIYGVPFWTSGGLLYYRTDLLEKYGFNVPTTWNQLTRQARRIVAGENDADPALRGYSGQFKQYEGLICNMQEFVLSNGGRLLTEDGNLSTVNSKANLEAVEFVRTSLIGLVAPRGVLTYEEPESLHLFVQGHAVFHRNWPYAWEISNDPKKSRIAGKVGIAVLPHFSEGESVSTLGGWQLAISRYTRKPDLAWKFVEFMTSERIQKMFAEHASQAPARRSVYKDADVLRVNPHFERLINVFEQSAPRPAMPLYPLYSSILQRFYHRALAFPKSPLAEAARRTDRKVEELLKLTREAGL